MLPHRPVLSHNCAEEILTLVVKQTSVVLELPHAQRQIIVQNEVMLK